MTNKERLANECFMLHEEIAPFIVDVLRECYGDRWWSHGVLAAFPSQDKRKKFLPAVGTDDEKQKKLDLRLCIDLMCWHCDTVFKQIQQHVTVQALRRIRRCYQDCCAHSSPGEDFSDRQTERVLNDIFEVYRRVVFLSQSSPSMKEKLSCASRKVKQTNTIRVYKLASQLKISSQVILTAMTNAGIKTKSPMPHLLDLHGQHFVSITSEDVKVIVDWLKKHGLLNDVD
ncbi:hypothetical protein FACS1894170_10330 [Planctomycetales bacterium]|nr:hypothetical protein FACS1894170_10330 [Planctomycetales bacterium]